MKTLQTIIITTTIIILTTLTSHAQECENFEKMQKKIETEKIAFLTKELNLSVKEAQKFWPLYNEAQDKRDKLIIQKRKLMHKLHKEIETMNDIELQKILDQVLSVDVSISKLKLDHNKKFEKIISPRKTAKLYQAEREFRETLLRDMKKGHYRR